MMDNVIKNVTLDGSGTVVIEGGVFSIDTADDAIHSDLAIVVNAGTFEIATGDDAIAMMQKQITEAYDNLEALDGLLQSWTSSFQNGMEYFSPEALRDMTEAELAKAQESLKALKECLPRIRVVFDRLKKRIGELEGMLNIDLSGDRLHHRRMEKISEVEELHAEVEGLLDSLIG